MSNGSFDLNDRMSCVWDPAQQLYVGNGWKSETRPTSDMRVMSSGKHRLATWKIVLLSWSAVWIVGMLITASAVGAAYAWLPLFIGAVLGVGPLFLLIPPPKTERGRQIQAVTMGAAAAYGAYRVYKHEQQANADLIGEAVAKNQL